MKETNKDDIAKNLKEMINVLEYDSMRSAGKAKLNSQHLHSMYWLLQNIYNEPAKPVKKVEEK